MTHESQACITPVLGRTKYFLGEVVLTYGKKAETIKNMLTKYIFSDKN